ncbi:uncharacterized protein LOC143041156 isoform X3 [Oratosquilla oratoria]|uniref:uncharacterized protein LOC143041156 isoform X3 n=1 Tax=Oratosquilla oratoria TaxID=337810 RepID=UPI003F775865
MASAETSADKLSVLKVCQVADLKKELKARGLPQSGNKNELVERLQEALASGDGGTLPLATTEGGGEGEEEEEEGEGEAEAVAEAEAEAEGEEEDFDEEEILAGEVDMDADLGKLTPQEEEAALQGTIRDSALLEPEKKKISLKRSEPTLPAQENGQEAADSNDKENTETTPPPKKIIKINAPPSDTPVASNLDARAQRFGISGTETSKKQARAERFGNTRRPAKLSSETGDIDVSKLKARAERFGEVTSKILTQAASNDQIKKRQERFGLVATSSETKTTTEPSDAKAARAARFGVSGTTTGDSTAAAATPATGTTTTVAAPVVAPAAAAAATPEEDEMKKKRAERFATK